MAESWTVRPARMDDLETAVPMFNAAARAMGSDEELTVERYRVEWQDSALDLENDTRVAVLPDGKVVGCIEAWNSTPFVHHWIWARVDPQMQGRGIGTALMTWAEERARQKIAKAPAGTRVYMQCSGPLDYAPTRDLMLDRGFAIVRRNYEMGRDLDDAIPEPVLPDGVVIRSMQPGEEAAVYRAQTEAFADHWGHVPTPFEQGFPRWQARTEANPYFDPSMWFLAVAGDEIAGISLCWPQNEGDTEMGWVGDLGVRRPWRRSGLGLALLYHSFRAMRERGLKRVGLGVDATSLTGATRLYERAGMRPYRESVTYEKELRPGRDLSTQSVEA